MGYADAVASILSHSPWGFWKQEETTGGSLADASGNARHMTLDGAGIQLNQAGPFGAKAVNYPVSVASNFAKTTASHTTSPATIELWLWVDNPNLNTTNPTPILCHQATDGSGSNDKNLTLRAVTSTTVRLTWHVNNGALREITADLTPTGTGQWFHVVASVGPAGQKIRVDGATLSVNAAVTSSYTTKAQWCQIHKCDIGRGAPGNGPVRVALPAFYTRQLSDAETDAHYTALGTQAIPAYLGANPVDALYLGANPVDAAALGGTLL